MAEEFIKPTCFENEVSKENTQTEETPEEPTYIVDEEETEKPKKRRSKKKKE